MDPNEAGVPYPTIGRIVTYRDEESGRDWPAIVTETEGLPRAGMICCTAFPPAAGPVVIAGCDLNDPATGAIEAGTWRWPVRQ